MARVLHLVIAACVVSPVASADEPPLADARAAIAERGIQLKAGKRHVVIIVPPAGFETSDLLSSKIHVYFGDAKTLYRQPVDSYQNAKSDGEYVGLQDWRSLRVSTLKRVGDTFSLNCGDSGKPGTGRAIQLGAPQPAKLAKSTVIQEDLPGYEAYLLARATSATTYYYVDRPRTENHDSEAFRLFIGKRGALKRVPIKEQTRDTTSDVFVTAKGTLMITTPKTKGEKVTVTFSPNAKKQETLTTVPVYPNRFMIYGDLGVYTRDPSGIACEEL